MLEASLHPEDALESAKIFDEGLVPGAGHLVHMPSHIYIRTGDYHKGTLANIRAVAVDSTYVAACNAQGAYPLAYFPHNYHFMAATAALEGNSELALKASNNVAKHSSTILMKEPGWGTLQHYYSIPFYMNVKFGKWHEILNIENEVPSLKYPSAVLNYARGLAFLRLDKIELAKKELHSLEIFAEDESLKEISIWEINSVDVLVQIAKNVLEAEIMAKESKYLESIALLKEAVKIEDDLNYNEPPDWFFSVRHHLGAVQIEAGLYNDAVQTYKDDLVKLPKNGWALHGLKLAYEKLDDQNMVEQIDMQIKESWSTADIQLTSSRIK
jgi:tetratricopeptide (TPR) repeat protein